MDETLLREALDAAREHLETLEAHLRPTLAMLQQQQREVHVVLSFIWAAIHLCTGPGELTDADRQWAHEAAQRLGMR